METENVILSEYGSAVAYKKAGIVIKYYQLLSIRVTVSNKPSQPRSGLPPVLIHPTSIHSLCRRLSHLQLFRAAGDLFSISRRPVLVQQGGQLVQPL